MAQMVKNLPAVWKTWVRPLGQEDPLKKRMALHSSILAWRIPWAEESDGQQSVGSQRVGCNSVTNMHIPHTGTHTYTHAHTHTYTHTRTHTHTANCHLPGQDPYHHCYPQMLNHFLGKSQRACLCSWNLEVWWEGLGGNLGSRAVLTLSWWFCPWGTCSVTVLIQRCSAFGENPGNMRHLIDAYARKSTFLPMDQALPCSSALHISSFPRGILKIDEDLDVIPWSWKLMGIPPAPRAPESSLDMTCTAWGSPYMVHLHVQTSWSLARGGCFCCCPASHGLRALLPASLSQDQGAAEMWASPPNPH